MNEKQTSPPTSRSPDDGLKPHQIGLIALTVITVLVVSTVLTAKWMIPQGEQENLARKAERYLRQRKGAPLSSPLTQLLTDPDLFLTSTDNHELLGQKAPRFSLNDHLGRVWDLEKLLKRGPVVVVFYYGYWCDHCVAQLFGIHEDITRFRELDATVIAISADPSDLTKERFKEYGAFAFPTLSDEDLEVATKYGCVLQGDEGKDPLHGTYVIDREGIVRWVNVSHRPFLGNPTLLYELAKSEGRLPVEASEEKTDSTPLTTQGEF